MELKKGYKQTEVGVIPDDWEARKLEELSYRKSGETITSEYINEFDTHPCFGGNGQRGYTSRATHNGDFAFIGRQGALCGNVQYVTGKFFASEHAIVVTPNIKTNIKWLYYMLADMNLNQYSESSAQPGLSVEKILKLPIPLPPTLTEQTAIATALSDADALISRLETLIDKKRAIKQGAMQQLQVGKVRLPGFSGEWNYKSFPNVCWYQEGPGLRNWQFTVDGIKVINVTNLENGILNLERTTRYISLEEFNNMYRHFEIDDKDIVVASSGNSYAKVAVFITNDLPLVMNTSVIRFKPLKDLEYNFLLQFLESNLFKDQIDLLITGGAQPNFGPAHLKKIQIKLPPQSKNKPASLKSFPIWMPKLPGWSKSYQNTSG